MTGTFSHRRVLLPVVHAITRAQTLENVDVAIDNGADGVFVINQPMSSRELSGLFAELRTRTPWLGANLLGHHVPDLIVDHGAELAGLWSDSAGVGESSSDRWIDEVAEARAKSGWTGAWFGGVCFKYGPRESASAEQIADLVARSGAIDVVTTSGPGTGRAAPPSKVRAFRQALGARPLALASGVTIDNVADYPEVDAFLVGTGLESEHGKLVPERVRELAERVHGG